MHSATHFETKVYDPILFETETTNFSDESTGLYQIVQEKQNKIGTLVSPDKDFWPIPLMLEVQLAQHRPALHFAQIQAANFPTTVIL